MVLLVYCTTGSRSMQSILNRSFAYTSLVSRVNIPEYLFPLLPFTSSTTNVYSVVSIHFICVDSHIGIEQFTYVINFSKLLMEFYHFNTTKSLFKNP